MAIPERRPSIVCNSRFNQPSADPAGVDNPVSRIACPSKWLRVRNGMAMAWMATSSFCCHRSRNGASPGASPNTSSSGVTSPASNANGPRSAR